MSYTNTPKLGLKKADPGTNQAFETDVFNDNLDAIDAEAVAVDGRFDVVEADNWVTTARIANGAVVSGKLALNSVGSGNIVEQGVGELNLSDGAVTNVKLWSGAVDSRVLAEQAVTLGKIAPNAVTAVELASNSVSSLELQSSAVTSPKIQSGAVQDSHLAGGLNASKLTFGVLNPGLLPAGGIQASQLANTLDLTPKSVYVNSSPSAPYGAVNVEVAQSIATSVTLGALAGRNVPAKFISASTTATPSSGVITVDLSGSGFGRVPIVTANIFQPSTTKFVVGIQSVTETQVQFRVLTSTGANATVSTRIDWQAVQTF